LYANAVQAGAIATTAFLSPDTNLFIQYRQLSELDWRRWADFDRVALVLTRPGMGIAAMTLGGCRTELADGRLASVLSEWDAGTVALHAVLPAGRAAKPSAKAFVDSVASELGK
jgi:DNA-binding transcriptional LysR family regulator